MFAPLFTLAVQSVHAAPTDRHTDGKYYDSLLPKLSYKSQNARVFLDMLDEENNFRLSGNSQKSIVKLLRIAGMKKTFRSHKLRGRLLLDIANLSTRLKMYPLAMKCYRQAIKIKREQGGPEIFKISNPGDTPNDFRLLIDDSAAILCHADYELPESELVSSADILHAFQDGKKAVSYGIIFHVKQPIYGKRKAFGHINNVGHTFITLIKLNDDNSSVSRSFGFYPAKKSFLTATPVHPSDKSVIKDDALHPWDETVAKMISEKNFKRLLSNLEKYSRAGYHLNRNNCTDFGLSEADMAGIEIRETSGRWPLGKGNNPANTGQSLLEKKFENNDPEYPETFTVNTHQIQFDDLN